MSTHRFIVEVEVSNENGPEAPPEGVSWPDRTPADYARDALNQAPLPEAARLDGYVDLPWDADIYVVEEA